MFDFVANHKRILQVILGLTILPFAFFGLDSYTRSAGGANEAASVDGTPVTVRELSEETRRQGERLRQMLGQNADPAMLDTPEMRMAILDSLVSQRLITNEVVNARLLMSKEEVVSAILGAPEFQENGKFSKERYEGYLRTAGLSDEGNVMKLRVEIPAARLATAINATAIQPRAVAARLAALEGEKREVAEAFITAEAYVAGIKPEEAALKAFYDSRLAEYKQPERVRAEYLVLSAAELGLAEGVSEAEVKAAYDARAGQFGTPEQRRASHILLKTKEEADKVLAEAQKAPQRFAELAKKYSQDFGSADKGGDLGMNARGALASKPLEDAIFTLKPGELSGVVQTDFGFHLVRLAAVQPGKGGTLEDVRKDLTAEIAKQKGQKKFAEQAEPFNNLVYEQSDSLKPAAERYKLKIVTTGWFSRNDAGGAGPLAHPKLLAALFSQDSTKQRRNTDAVEVEPGVLVAARVTEHQAEAQRPYEEVKADVTRRLVRREAAALAKKAGEEKLAALVKGGDAGLTWAAAKTVSRQDGQGLPAPALRKVMTANAAKLPAYAGAERGEDGYAIYRISKLIAAEAKTGPQAAESQARYERQAGSEQLDAYVASLRAKAKIEVRPLTQEQKQ